MLVGLKPILPGRVGVVDCDGEMAGVGRSPDSRGECGWVGGGGVVMAACWWVSNPDSEHQFEISLVEKAAGKGDLECASCLLSCSRKHVLQLEAGLLVSSLAPVSV